MKNNILIALFVSIILVNLVEAQTGIGTNIPDQSAVLEIASTDRGILIPRVNLQSIDHDIDGVSGQAEGLMIYNIGNTLRKGFYFWNGNEWRTIDDKTAVIAEITEISCVSAKLEPATFVAGEPYTGLLRVSYKGGNGGTYSGGAPIPSTINTGLTATLKQGELEYGTGTFVYDVTGTPSASSPTGASFALTFGTANPQSCTAIVGVASNAIIEEDATLGPLFATNDNGFPGYHRTITSPDGKFSVRVFIRDNEILANADLQIRSNTGAKTIMWNGIFAWNGGNNALATNALNLPNGGVWYGNTGDNGLSSATAAWGDPDVYYGAPEQREYLWTTTDIEDQTTYAIKFMLGAPSPSLSANATNAPRTKAYLRITQITAAD